MAAAFYRKKTYDFYKNLYVVAYQQNLHFRQLFKVLELMGADFAKDCVHVAFGMVSLADGTLSTREGRVVFLEDVLKSAIEKTRSVIDEKNPELENKDEVSRQIGVGAVVFSVLQASRIKDITFDLDRLLNFDGETGPYVQYTHARACSLLRRSAGSYDTAPDYRAPRLPPSFRCAAAHRGIPGNCAEGGGEIRAVYGDAAGSCSGTGIQQILLRHSDFGRAG